MLTENLTADVSMALQLHTSRGALVTRVLPGSPADVAGVKAGDVVVRVAGRESEYLPLRRRIASIYADAYGETHPVAIRALAEVFHQERREYGPGGGRETAARIESLTRDALGETSALGAFVRNVFAFARDTAEGAEPWNPPLSARRERFLAEPGPLATELLADLDEVRWASLEHAYGPAVDTPLQIRLLLADDELVRRDALDALGQALLHQGSRYPATEPALSFVRRLADDERVPDRGSLADLLAAAGR